ncbi:hypothetical protein [Streptococcus pneumoniae]|uniref:hypothetical protein n=1 Tax=Streptococcus pneumoniae TaxID=1313 RepID=UPI001869B5CF|nr:hypothetical protein [Streptococcus pneumoniae]
MQPVLTKYKIDAIKEFYSSFSHSYYPSKRDDVIVQNNSNYCKIPTKKREPKLSFLGSIIFVVGKSLIDIMEPILL